MNGSRILITGVSGFVGSHMARRVSERGDTALGLGVESPLPSTESFLASHWNADIRNGQALQEAISEARPTAIVHLAAQSSGAVSFERPVETYSVNALGTLTLLEAVKRAAPRSTVLVVGTGEVYGPQPKGTRVAEASAMRPVSPYALSKAAADAIAETFSRLWNLAVVRCRSFGHIGRGQSEPFVVPSWARQIAEIEAGRREAVLHVGNLDVVRDLTDVRDVVEAYLALLDRGRPGSVYNVCRGEGTRLLDLTRSLCQRAQVPVRIEVDPTRVRSTDIRYLVGDPTAIDRDTGWRATIPLERTLDDVMDEWRTRVAAGRAT